MAWTFKHLFSNKSGSAQPSTDTMFQRGNAHVSQRQWQPALECYRDAVRANPNHAEAYAYLGNVLCQLGALDEAIIAYDHAIAIKPDYAEAHYNRGALLQRMRQLRAALESYDLALSINWSFTQAHCSRGEVLSELGRTNEALASYDMAIATDGNNSKAYLHRGVLQQQLQQLGAAEASYKQAITLRPHYADAYFDLGTLQSDAGRVTDALTSFDAAIAAAPDHAGAHAGRGLALMALGQPDAAVASFEMAIRLKPDFTRAYGSLAQAQEILGLLVEARASHAQAVLLDPQDATIHFNRGSFLSDLKDWKGAIESYQAAIALKPDFADAFCNLGLAKQEGGQVDAALESYSTALEINPAAATVFNNRGNLYRSKGQFDEALMDYRQAIALEPNFAEAHYNIGQLALLQGNFAAGWPGYEWRRQIEEALAANTRVLPQPAWFGDYPLEGKRIFLHAEQGLGDTIQFCRYVRLVASLGANVTLEVQPSLGNLLANIDGVSKLILFGDPIPPADCQCSIMSLPGAFKTTLDTIPCQVPYLRADPLKVAHWHRILGPRKRLRIGLAWSGNPSNRNDHNRSVDLARWIDHLPDECEYICLQKEIRDADRRILSSSTKFTNIESHNQNFTDTAALVETLDLVISVCTSLAHLSGAMGQKTWILLPFLPDWRWLMNRRDTPWYPTATLYRQPVAGDWDSVMEEVSRDILLQCQPLARGETPLNEIQPPQHLGAGVPKRFDPL
jgi:tetratricopeptide (TPR) repeat protein